jgi:esterase/lipase superfamily enzyme
MAHVDRYWMITNRERNGNGLSGDEGPLSFWSAPASADLAKDLRVWTERTERQFVQQLTAVADGFPRVTDAADHERQQHVSLFVHGFNNSWLDAVRRYGQIARDLFFGNAGLGLCVLFTWPSDGLKVGYYPDRLDARRTADDLAAVLTLLYAEMESRQDATLTSGRQRCKAKTSVIAHSMGNFVVQRALQHVWTRKNRPLLMSLINQLLMVAADVDNDLFSSGEDVKDGDGEGLANLTYRITALYTGLDSTLGLSAGFKHFGKRRLGRSGLDRGAAPPDNVWSIDCSHFLQGKKNIHSAYFDDQPVQSLMRDLLRGLDRRVLVAAHGLGEVWPQ